MAQATGDDRRLTAVDTHAHVFERGLPLAAGRRYAPDYDATLDEYLGLLHAHGLSHGVLVQPSFLGTDNRYLVRALRKAGPRLRGVAVVDPGFGEPGLRALAEAGVAGMRLNLMGLADPPVEDPAWQALLARVNRLGWHVELHVQAARLATMLPPLLAAGCRIVVDHFGRPDSLEQLRPLLAHAGTGQVWVKLSAPYRNWATLARAQAREDASREATQRLLAAFGPQHLMWGSDWPHTEHRDLADYGSSRARLDGWIADPDVRRRILADTPLHFFQFPGD